MLRAKKKSASAVRKFPNLKKAHAEKERIQALRNPLSTTPKDAKWHFDQAEYVRSLYDRSGNVFEPTRQILRAIVQRAPDFDPDAEVTLTEEECNQTIWKYVQFLLKKDFYQAAAVLLWGNEIFTPKPYHTRLVWKALSNHNRNLIMGGGSLSKSYSGAVFYSLRWLEDPEWTCFKVMSATKEHAKRNIFAHMKNLLSSTIVPVPGIDIKAESIQINNNDKQGIHLVSIPQGDDGKGRLRGFHPVPRGFMHPKFGPLSVVGCLMDEAEEIPEGVWEDINNILLTEDKESDSIFIFAATNPRDRQSRFGQEAEPVQGWSSLDIDESEEWESARGWHVTRLDGAKCENVQEKRIIFPGLQTWEGFENLLKLGTNNAEYYCADEKTEVLSKRGWLKGADLKLGDEIWTVNSVSGIAEWKPTKEIFNKPFKGDLVRFQSRNMDALVTPNHRWAVTNKQTLSTKRPLRLKIKETGDLARHDCIPLIRDCVDNKSSYSEDFAALCGWIITDGSFGPYGGKRIYIYQSIAANAHKCQTIRDLLIRLNARFTERIYNGMIHFRFSCKLAWDIRKACPGKKLTMKFVEHLGKNEREALLEALIQGDGGIQGGSTPYVCTKDEEQAGMYAALMARCGFASRIHTRHDLGGTFKKTGLKSKTCTMYYVDLKRCKYARVNEIKKTLEYYEGNVWCPRTDNETFYARRNGVAYFTGNTMGRGWFPEASAQAVIITEVMFERSKGIYQFTGPTIASGGVDLAFEGGDQVIYTHFRHGLAIGYRDMKNEFHKFKRERRVIQVENQFPMEKLPSDKQASAIKRLSRELDVKPTWLAVDRTGNGTGVHDILLGIFGPQVLGINFAWAATDTRILDDDTMDAGELYGDIITEMAFAVRRFMETDTLKLHCGLNWNALERVTVNRKYRQVGRGIVKIESKPDYKKKHQGVSPDRFDSLIIGVHNTRLNGAVSTVAVEQPVRMAQPIRSNQQHGIVDTMNFMEVTD